MQIQSRKWKVDEAFHPSWWAWPAGAYDKVELAILSYGISHLKVVIATHLKAIFDYSLLQKLSTTYNKIVFRYP